VHSQTIANLRPINGLNRILAYDGVGHVPMWENAKNFEKDLDVWIKDAILNPKKPKPPKTPLPQQAQLPPPTQKSPLPQQKRK